MSREDIKISLGRIFEDRGIVLVGLFLLLACVAYCVTVGANIHQSDVTVYSRYTAFGETHFYKAHWQYLLSFIAFGPIVAASHLMIMGKLHTMERRQTAIMVGWAGIVILVLGLVYALSVVGLGIAV